MDQSRGTFLAGVVFGMGLGLLAGHFTLWRSPRPAGVDQLGAPVHFGTSHAAPQGVPYFERSASFPLEQFETAEDEEVSTYPSPLANALALELVDESASPTSGEVSASPRRLQPIDEPQPLDIPVAEPLSEHQTRNEQFVRELIQSELGESTEAQREVWFEALKDLRREDVAGVLRMWKLFGGPLTEGGEGELEILTPNPDASFQPGAVTVPDLPSRESSGGTDFRDLARQARDVHLRNLRMASTPGYVRLIPRFLETPGDDGPRLDRVVTDPIFHHRGTPIITDNQLDCLIDGSGLFVVENEAGERFYTRNGRFSIGRDDRLVLRIGADEFAIVPAVTLPDEAGPITVLGRGKIVVPTEDEGHAELGTLQLADVIGRYRLEYVANGLFRVADDAADDVRTGHPGEHGLGLIESGRFEGSNVIPAAEWAELDQLQRLLNAD